MRKTIKHAVPKGTENPVAYLLLNDVTMLDLAVAWGLSQTESVYRLRRFAHVPSTKTAALMGKTFGWTAGEVIDHWLAQRRKLTGKSA